MQENRSPGPLGDTLPTCSTTRPMMPVPVQPKPMDRQRANRLRPTWQKRERLYGNTPFHGTLRRSNACRRGASRSRSVRDIRHGSSRNTNVMPWRNGPDCMRLWNLCSTAWKPLILPVLWDVAKPNFLTNRNAACFGDSPHFGISVPCPCTDFNLHGRSGSVMSESGSGDFAAGRCPLYLSPQRPGFRLPGRGRKACVLVIGKSQPNGRHHWAFRPVARHHGPARFVRDACREPLHGLTKPDQCTPGIASIQVTVEGLRQLFKPDFPGHHHVEMPGLEFLTQALPQTVAHGIGHLDGVDP